MRTLALCVAVLVLAACGGSGSATLTKAQLDAKLSRLCLVAADQFRELHLGNDIADWKHDGAQIVRIQRSFTHKLAALKPPASLAAAVRTYEKGNDAVTRDTAAAVAAAKAGNGGKFFLALALSSHDAAATSRAAKAIGATGCYIG